MHSIHIQYTMQTQEQMWATGQESYIQKTTKKLIQNINRYKSLSKWLGKK